MSKKHPPKKHGWLTHIVHKIKKRIGHKLETQEHLLVLLKEAENRSLLNIDTLLMLESVLQFSDMKVRDIMVPRSQMISVSIDAEWETLVNVVHASGHSRFPALGSHRDEVVGILHAKNLITAHASDAKKFNLKDILKPATFVPESKPLDILLKEFRRNRNHMAMVVDEYGNVCGFVTIEDLIEQIVGDIADEFDIDEDAYIKKHSDNQYILKAHMPIEDFNEYFSAEFGVEEFDTIGGMILKKLAHMPKKGEKLSVNRYDFKVISADTRRIKLLRLTIRP
jgi:magnesium and cobalt transporter